MLLLTVLNGSEAKPALGSVGSGSSVFIPLPCVILSSTFSVVFLDDYTIS